MSKHRDVVFEFERRIAAAHKSGSPEDPLDFHAEMFSEVLWLGRPRESYEANTVLRVGTKHNTGIRSPSQNVTFTFSAKHSAENEFTVHVRPEIQQSVDGGIRRNVTDIEFHIQSGQLTKRVLYLGSREIVSYKGGRRVSKTQIAFVCTTAHLKRDADDTAKTTDP